MITLERLKELLSYDPETGEFRWKVFRGGMLPGTVAGRVAAGYRQIGIDRRLYQAHRLAWLYTYGVWPPVNIDHINRQPSDNRIANLRPATVSQNGANVSAGRRNKSGFKGVRFQRGRWEANIKVRGCPIYLGLFDTPEEASAAYRAVALQHFGEFALDAA